MPDLYADPRRKLEYAEYMSNLSEADLGKGGKEYYRKEAATLRASRKGHEDATRKTTDEIARRQRDARSNQANQGKPRSR